MPNEIGSGRNQNWDTANTLGGWHTDFLNFRWIQRSGNESTFLGTIGPGSDFKSICKEFFFIFLNEFILKA